MRPPPGSTAAEPGDHRVERHAVRERDRGGERGVHDLVRAVQRRGTRGPIPTATRGERRPQLVVEHDRPRRGPRRRGAGADRDEHDGRAGARRELGRSRRRRRRAPRARRRGSASSSAPSRARPRPDPRGARRATSPMFVTTPMSGRAIAHSAAMSPGCRAPSSSDHASVSSGAPKSVIGRPISALKFPGVAWTRNAVRSAAAVRSFVLVLPVEPVMPTTRARPRAASRAHRPSARERRERIRSPARPRTARRPATGTGRVTSATVAPRANASATKSWPSRVRDPARRSTPRGSSVRESLASDDARARRARDQCPAGDGRDLGRGQLHAERSELFTRDDAVVEREGAGRRSSGRSRDPCRR